MAMNLAALMSATVPGATSSGVVRQPKTQLTKRNEPAASSAECESVIRKPKTLLSNKQKNVDSEKFQDNNNEGCSHNTAKLQRGGSKQLTRSRTSLNLELVAVQERMAAIRTAIEECKRQEKELLEGFFDECMIKGRLAQRDPYTAGRDPDNEEDDSEI